MGDTILERLNYLAKINETNFIKQLVLVKIFIFFNQERVNIDALKVLFVMLKKSENIVKAVVIQLANIPYFWLFAELFILESWNLTVYGVKNGLFFNICMLLENQ